MANSTLQEWLNRNAYRRFPLVEDSDMSCAGGLRLPDSAVLDARFCLFGAHSGPVELTAVRIENGVATAFLSLPGGVRAEVSGNGYSTWSDGIERSARVCLGTGEDGYYILLKPVRFLPSRVMSVPYGIGADTITAGGVTATGDVRVSDGHNTTLSIRRNNLVLGIGRGDGLGVVCRQGASAITCDGRVLYYLNGQKADSDGNIEISGGDGVSVSTGTYKGIPAVIVRTSATVNSFAYG